MERKKEAHVMLVEDSPTQAKMLQAVLRSSGFDITLATTFKEASKKIFSESVEKFDVILCDIHLPDGSGFDLCQKVGNSKIKNIPVVLITGDSAPSNVLRGLEAGASGFIRKDCNLAHIKTRILRSIKIREKLAKTSLPTHDIDFLGKQYRVHENYPQLMNVLLSAFEDVVYLSEDRLKIQQCLQRINEILKKEISDREEAEKKVAEQQHMLVYSSKMTALGEMAGGIAHEINNPLATIRGNAELLGAVIQSGKLDKELISSIAVRIEQTVIRISKIIQGLRSFCRGGQGDPFDIVKLKDIFQDTIEFCIERIRNHNIEFSLPDIPDNIRLECRATEISQVILNLLNNATDAVFSLKEKWIKVDVLDNDESIRITITDSGKGISKEHLTKIFQPFFTTKEVGKGTGIGLSISTGIIENHDGRLYVDSTCKNTCFVIELPKKQSIKIKGNKKG